MDSKKIRLPKYLRAATRAWIKGVINDYELEPHHIRLLLLAGQAYDRAAEAREVLAEKGLVYTDRFSQPRQRPENGIERAAMVTFSRLLRELALDVEAPDDTRLPRIKG
jgi:hypothetical protein